MSQAYEINLAGKNRESSDAYSLQFNIPEEIATAFHFKAGQYLTIEAEIKGQKIRRAYSISSRTDEMPISIVVKKVQNGLMSNYLIDQVSEGDKLQILPPEGRFIIRPEFNNQKQYFFFAAGSGITPVMSMIKTILEFEPKSEITLLYGNRKQEDIIYEAELRHLENLHKGQFNLHFTLSKAPKSGLSGLWKKKQDSWDGLKGRIDKEMVKVILADHRKPKIEANYFICGPGEMIPIVKKSLHDLQVDDKNIHMEYFANPDQDGANKPSDLADISSKLTVTLEGQTIESIVKSEETILNHLIKLGYDPPYSCTSGTCSTCMAKVSKGSVKMDACFALEDSEVADGYILTCQSHATSEELVLSYEI
jgi:ring-1,2-phenylacetyl-CoA epoxidase subunit PaaE